MVKESLSVITLNITNKCNLNCEYCKSTSEEDLLSLEDIKNIIDDTVSLKTQMLAVSGGEPTLRKDYRDIIEYANNKGLYVTLLTNGSTLKKEDVCYIKDNVDIIRLTLDSASESKHDLIKGHGEFAKLMRLIGLFNEGGVAVNLNVPIGVHNVNEINEIIKFALDVGAQTIRFAPLIPSFDEHLYVKLLNNIIKAIIKHHSKIYFADFKSVSNKETFIESVTRLTCPGGVISVNINSDGGYTICPFCKKQMGSLVEDSLRKLWFEHYDTNLGKSCEVLKVDMAKLLHSCLNDEMWRYTVVRKAVSAWYSEISSREKMCLRGLPFWHLTLLRS